MERGMTKEFDELGIETLKQWAKDQQRLNWHKVAKAQTPTSPKSELLEALTEKREMWELTLAAMGAAISEAPRDASSLEVDKQLRAIAVQIGDHVDFNQIPGLGAAVSTICTIEHESLVQEAPALLSILQRTDASALGVLLCLELYPKDKAAYIECIRNLR